MIELLGVGFRYPSSGGFGLFVPELRVPGGDCLALVGPSGSGKTTLLGLLAGILKPSRGALRIGGTDLAALDEKRRRQFRIDSVGQVFQAFELLHYLTVLENVMLPAFIGAAPDRSRRPERRPERRARDLLAEVGLGDRAGAYPGELSQGEQQRVAVCRAMLNRPRLLLADEPTGNLDQANKQNVVDLLLEQARGNRSTLVMVTHDESLLGSFPRVLDIRSVIAPAPGEGRPA